MCSLGNSQAADFQTLQVPQILLSPLFSVTFTHFIILFFLIFPIKLSKNTLTFHKNVPSFSLIMPAKTTLCFISVFSISNRKQRRTHLCLNPNYGRAIPSIKPWLLSMDADCHATNQNILLLLTKKNDGSFPVLIWIRLLNTSHSIIQRLGVLQKIRPRFCAL